MSSNQYSELYNNVKKLQKLNNFKINGIQNNHYIKICEFILGNENKYSTKYFHSDIDFCTLLKKIRSGLDQIVFNILHKESVAYLVYVTDLISKVDKLHNRTWINMNIENGYFCTRCSTSNNLCRIYKMFDTFENICFTTHCKRVVEFVSNNTIDAAVPNFQIKYLF